MYMKQTTFKELSQMWSDMKRPLVKHSTMCAYRLIIRHYLLPYFGTATEISEGDVQQFIISQTEKGLARKTIRDIVATLKAVVKFGAGKKLFRRDEWMLTYPSDASERHLQTLSMSQQRKLMRHLTENPSHKNVGILIAICTGMRIGEVCALQWKDVDLIQRVITVRRTVGRVYNSDMRATEKVFSKPKTQNSFREIPVSKPLHAVLRELKRASDTPFVVGRAETSTEPRAYRDYFYRLLQRLGIPHIVFHGLRHTFATRCIESHCDYKTVSAILGHSNVSTTLNLYVHPNIDQKKRCIQKMNKFVGMD